MTAKASSVLEKKYYRLSDLASQWNVEVSELLNFAIEGVLIVAIEDFSGFEPAIPKDDCEPTDINEEKTAFPAWTLFLATDVLKRLAVQESVVIEGGFRSSSSGLRPIFSPPRKVTVNDLIVPRQSLAAIASPMSALEPAASQASKNTLLKQIAALALVLANKHQQFVWGKNPNCSEIAKAIAQVLSQSGQQLADDFYGKTAINDSIREGLILIGFKEEEDSK